MLYHSPDSELEENDSSIYAQDQTENRLDLRSSVGLDAIGHPQTRSLVCCLSNLSYLPAIHSSAEKRAGTILPHKHKTYFAVFEVG